MKIVHVFLLLVQHVESLFFEMGEKETKCFVEEIPEETMVVGKYNTQLFDDKSNEWQRSAPGMGMHVEVSDPEQKVPS
jgi:p24 family protein alpha